MLMNARDKETGDAMSERELIDEVMTLVVAGHETTASALNWTWYLLSQHPEVEAKLHAELDADPRRKPRRASTQMEALAVHASGGRRSAAPVSARLDSLPPHDRRPTSSAAMKCRRARA